jgi:ribose transport system ATP-binding protein
MEELLLKADNITKRFPGVLALDRVSFDLRPGEVHILFGENGAGKSTLNKILAGSYLPDEGQIYLKGKQVQFRNPLDARMAGISAVYQEFSLVPQLSVLENLFLGGEIVKKGLLDRKAMLNKAEALLKELGFDLDPKANVGALRRAERQMVEIAKAFQHRMDVLMLDEPTASLTDKEVQRLFQIIKQLTGEGVGIIYISHRIDELKQIGDRITILRDGKLVDTLDMAGTDEEILISLMTGREVQEIFPTIGHAPGETVLSVEGLSTVSGIHDISFEVRSGEILGIAGLVGAGKSRVGRAIFGLDEITAGRITLNGQPFEKPSPARCIKKGILYFPPDRHKEGLVLCRSVKENQTLVSIPLFERGGFIDARKEGDTVKEIVEKMNIRPQRIDQTINYLSGGNQQKVMLSRGITRAITVFIFDEASCGIDVGAKHDVYMFLKEQAELGAAVIFISSELPEILNLSHTVMVMHAGTNVLTIPGEQATEEIVLGSCFGYDHNGSGTECVEPNMETSKKER